MKTRIWVLLLLLPCLLPFSAASIRDGDDDETFVVVRASPNTTDQLEFVRDLHDNMHNYDLDFWLTPHAVGHLADVMVRESRLPWLEEQLSLHGIHHFVSVPDVQKLIIEREQKGKSSKSSHFLEILQDFRKRYKDEGGNKARFDFGDYHSYQVIMDWMHEIERLYPDRAKVITIGETVEGRPIKTLKLGTNIHSTQKRVIWIDGGIHAREWAAVHTTCYFIERLIADYNSDSFVREAMDNLHFYITPVMNPDGYEFSRTGVSPMIRLWRKNRSNMVCKKDRWFRDRCCGGVDLNRNFDWFWGEIGSSADRCSEIYQGSSAWSEAESKAVRDMMFSPELRGKVDAFITLHTYSQMWIHPFSHQRKTVPEDIAETEEVGRKAVSALEAMYGTKYRFGTGADILYPSSGGSDDWAKGKGGAKFVYLLELRPGEEVWDGFILDSRQLMPTAKETWAGVRVVIEAVLKRLRRAADSLATLRGTVSSWEHALHFNQLILGLVKELYTPAATTTVIPEKEQGIDKREEAIILENSPGILPMGPVQNSAGITVGAEEFPGFGSSDFQVISPSLRRESLQLEEKFLRMFNGSSPTNKLEEENVEPAEKIVENEVDYEEEGNSTSRAPIEVPPRKQKPASVLVTSQVLSFPAGDSLPVIPYLQNAVSATLTEEELSPVLVAANPSQSNQMVVVEGDSGFGGSFGHFSAGLGTTATTATTSTTAATATTATATTVTTATPRIEIVRPRVGFRPRSRRPIIMRPETAKVLLAERFKQQQENLVENTRKDGRRRGQGNVRIVSGNVQNMAPTVVEHFPAQSFSPQGRPMSSPCIDKSPWCMAWINGNANICSISSIYMRRDCARSCRYCA